MEHALLVSTPMLSKIVATWLAVLIIVPFTAPFSTCDLATLVANAHDQRTPVAPRSSVASATDVAVAPVIFVSNSGGGRLLPLCRISLAESALPCLTASLMSSIASTADTREHTVASAVLRV